MGDAYDQIRAVLRSITDPTADDYTTGDTIELIGDAWRGAYVRICVVLGTAADDAMGDALRDVIAGGTPFSLRETATAALLDALGMETPDGILDACAEDVPDWTAPLATVIAVGA